MHATSFARWGSVNNSGWDFDLAAYAGQLVLGLAIAAVIVFTGWRIHRLWRKYQRLLHELEAAEAAKLSNDPKEVERAEGISPQRRMKHVADMTLMSGFVLGAAASDYAHGVNRLSILTPSERHGGSCPGSQ